MAISFVRVAVEGTLPLLVAEEGTELVAGIRGVVELRGDWL